MDRNEALNLFIKGNVKLMLSDPFAKVRAKLERIRKKYIRRAMWGLS